MFKLGIVGSSKADKSAYDQIKLYIDMNTSIYTGTSDTVVVSGGEPNGVDSIVRDHDPFSCTSRQDNGRQQICQRFPDTSSSLSDKVTTFVKCERNSHSHFRLLRSKFIAGKCLS